MAFGESLFAPCLPFVLCLGKTVLSDYDIFWVSSLILVITSTKNVVLW